MVKIAYTNISPISCTYNNINHFFYIKREINPKKLYVCIWDNFVFEDDRFYSKNSYKDKFGRLKENVEVIEKILNYLEMDYKIIYLSEAWNRLFRKNEYSNQIQVILSNIKMGNIFRASKFKNILLDEINISKINYIIADYLIACYLEELYPEICSSQVNEYINIYIKLFEDAVKDKIKLSSNKKFPKISVVNNAPIIIHKSSGIIPSYGMNYFEVKRIIKNYFNNKDIEPRIVFDLLSSFNYLVKDKDFLDPNNKKINIDELKSRISNNIYCREELAEVIAINLMNYFEKVKGIVNKVSIKNENKTAYITQLSEFKRYIGVLNPLKLKILRYCDGNNTSLDISRLSGLKLSTVSTYLSKLKLFGIISDERKPKRKIDNLVLSLDIIED